MSDDPDPPRDPMEGLLSLGADELPTVKSDPPPIGEQAGDWIGPYRLLQVIGEGGMGTVWMAERREPFEQKVALKIIKAGMDTREVMARFEAERQALAMMNHPSIAHVLDGGATDAGRPYFVMELVHGLPITDYCNQARLGTRDRLELFRQVCEAVAHAHQKGIIHRDLKPSNILVTKQDDRPLPKVIDFGVAKATGQKLTEQTLFTRYGQMVGTLPYMSPEQAQFSAEDVDTRSDIYSLGVLLYELLTGSTPLEDQELREKALDEICRVIRDVDPPTPSTKLSTMGVRAATVAAKHGTTLKELGRAVRHELDWIVMCALEKDRSRRYQSVGGFGDDVGRYLRDEAVMAGPPSRWYRGKKFARRNKGALVATAIVMAAMVAATVFSSWMAVRESAARAGEKEEREAAMESLRIAGTAIRDMLAEVGDESLAEVPAMEKTREALLRRAVVLYQDLLQVRGSGPELRRNAAEAQADLANIFHLLGENERAAEEFKRSIEEFRSLVSDFPEDLSYLHGLAWVLQESGRFHRARHDLVAAKAAATESVPYFARLASAEPENTEFLVRRAHAFAEHGILLADLQQEEDATAEYEQALTVLEAIDPSKLDDESRFLQASLHNNLGIIHVSNGKLPEAHNAYEKARDILTPLADKSQDYADALAANLLNQGIVASNQDDLEAMEALNIRAIEQYQKLQDSFPKTPKYRWAEATVHLNTGGAFLNAERYEDGLQPSRRAAELFESLSKEYPGNDEYRRMVASASSNAGACLMCLDEFEEAAAEFDKARELQEELVKRHKSIADFRAPLARTCHNLGMLCALKPKSSAEAAKADFENAVEAFQEAGKHLAILTTSFGENNQYRLEEAINLSKLGFATAETGEIQRGKILFEDAMTKMKDLAPDFREQPFFKQEHDKMRAMESELIEMSEESKR